MTLWLPLVVALSLGLLRPMKGLLIALQFRNNARQGLLVAARAKAQTVAEPKIPDAVAFERDRER